MSYAPALLLLTCVACAPSALLRPDDASFHAAHQELIRSVEAAQPTPSAKAPAPAPDTVLWLQAESFYRYRFDLNTPRSTGSYVAQLAAATTDFAPLLVAASAEGMMDLRLHAYDGAAQLYEELVARHPDSPYRPLALYRLGWTYRSTLTEGFPRDSAGALEQLQRDYPDAPVAALVPQVLAVPWKSHDTAAVLSLIPGAGQLYVGETANGLARLGLSLGFAALAVVPIVSLAHERHLRWVPIVLSSAGFAGLQVSYTAAYQDAQRAVLQFNERQEAAFAARHPEAP
jgi:TM2 domain-containing membrane protein YozV